MEKPKKITILAYTPNDSDRKYNEAIDAYETWLKENYDVPLQRLTPGGSEFVNNPKRCFDYIKDRLNDVIKAEKYLARFKREAKEN